MVKFNWPLQKNTIRLKERLALAKFVLTADRFTNGPECLAFEKEWSTWQGKKYSLFVSSGTTANALLLDAVREQKFPGKEKLKILCPAVNWATNISTFKQQGHEVFFYDIDHDNYSATWKSIEFLCEQQIVPDIIYVTHIMGFACRLKNLKDRWPNAIILEDCCESHGALNEDRVKVGTEGLGSTFSFYFGHHMTTIEGGMVCTDDKELYNLMRAKRSHGMSREMLPTYKKKYEEESKDIDPMFLFPTEGFNYRNTELGAVLGRIQLKKLNSFIKKRQRNFYLFRDLMTGHPWISDFPIAEGNSAMTLPFHCVDENKKQILKEFLNEIGVETRPFLVGNLLRQPFMNGYNHPVSLPNSERIHTHSFYIGNNHFITENDIVCLTKALWECAL